MARKRPFSHSGSRLEAVHRYYRELSALAAQQGSVTDTHSVEEARARHSRKADGAAGVARRKE